MEERWRVSRASIYYLDMTFVSSDNCMPGDQLSALLQTYNINTDGTLATKRKQSKRFIGFMVEIETAMQV